MRIVFSDHAIERMIQRNISKLQVYVTVKSPQEKVISYRDRIIYRRKFESKTFEVITKQENDLIIIISAFMVK